MKTVSEFKRRIKLGTLLHCTYHREFSHRGENGIIAFKDKDLGIRPVSVVQTNSFALKTKRTTGQEIDSWCEFPKRTEVILLENGLTILEEDYITKGEFHPILTYTFVN